MSVLENLQPKDVFKYFEDISNIPRGSGNVKEISDYLVEFAKEHNLEFIQEKCNNVIIKKPEYVGYEHVGAVMLQGHIDMVCEKNNDSYHNFEEDPLKLKIQDDFIYADNTTLGADNGVAVAYMLAILADKTLKHPKIEAVFTVDEETTMLGVQELAVQNLSAKYMINMDIEEEGQLLLSCSGGAKSIVRLPIRYTSVSRDCINATIKVRGLKGGHSGVEINQNRGNSNQIMGRLLYELNGRLNFEIVSIDGGAKDNAIPRECDTVITLLETEKFVLEDIIKNIQKQIYDELKGIDDGFRVEIEYTNKLVDKVFDMQSRQKVIDALMVYTSGVMQMSLDINGLVETSNNLGVVKTIESQNVVTFECAMRSSIDSQVEYILKKHESIANLLGADYETKSVYPGWKYKKNSKLRQIFSDTYEELDYGKIKLEAIHAGLECGFMSKKMPDLDIIAFGPNMYDIHTPNEHLSISSTKRMYEFLIKGLENMKDIK